MTTPPASRSTLILACSSFGLQVVTAVALMLSHYLADYHHSNSSSWMLFALAALIPLMAQVLICWIKNEPVIHVASLIASGIILAVIIHDHTVPSYVRLGLIAPWPVVFLVMMCGNVVAWILESRRRAREIHAGQDC